MEIFVKTLLQLISMFTLIFIGSFLTRMKMLNDELCSALSRLLLYVIIPLTIIVNASKVAGEITVKNIMIAIVLSLMLLFFSIVFTRLIFRSDSASRYATLFPNSGFMGIPLVLSLFGPEGLIYLSTNIAVMNTFAYSYGFNLLTHTSEKRKTNLKSVINPGTIGCILALVFIVFRIRFHPILLEPLETLSLINTPIAMLIIGNYIYRAGIVSAVKNKSIWMITLIRLFVLPIFYIVIINQIPVGTGVLKLALIVAMICPTAFHFAVISRECNNDYIYASQVIVISTLISVISMPIVMLIASHVLQ